MRVGDTEKRRSEQLEPCSPANLQYGPGAGVGNALITNTLASYEDAGIVLDPVRASSVGFGSRPRSSTP